MKLFTNGRKNVFSKLSTSINNQDKIIWFHCASLGEFEQGLPLMEDLKTNYPSHKLLVTFFSPSGYEIKKNHPIGDVIVYLPLDTPSNAKKFIELTHPSLVVFIKYEFWPNYLQQLKKENIKTILVSGLFRESQLFFKPYGGFMRNALNSFEHFFVQDQTSENLLHEIKFTNTSLNGDTRFDRVANQLKQDNTLGFIEDFKQDALCVVCGSTWPEDEEVLLDSINLASENVKYIIAPHNIDHKNIKAFKNNMKKPVLLFSEMENKNLSDYSVLIIDTIGLLSKIYNYADIAYVGGAMGKTGLHNILEPITFGVPIIIGQHFKKFPEASSLLNLNGLFSIKNSEECSQILSQLIQEEDFRNQAGKIAKKYATDNIGATNNIVKYIDSLKF